MKLSPARPPASLPSPEPSTEPTPLSPLLVWLRRLLPLVFLITVWILAWHELRQIDVHVLRSSVQALPFSNMLMLQLLALLAVFSMVLYDWQLSRWLSIPLAAPTLLRYSWVANSFNNFIGLSGLAGSGIRFLLLAKQGVATRTASVYSGAIMLAVPVGLAVLALLVLLFGHARVSNLGIPNWLAHLVLLGFAAYAPVFLWLIGRGGLLRRLTRGANPLHLRHGLWLIATSVLDWLLAMAVAWVSLWLSGAHVSIITFVAAFTLAAALGILSLIPGGLGVFDGSLLLLLSASGVANASVLAGLVIFRLVYYIVPWFIGLYLGAGLLMTRDGSLLARLARHWHESAFFNVLRLPLGVLASLGVRLLGYLTFVSGVVLLISAAFPTLHDRLVVLHRFVPLPAIEVSHILSVGVGVLLLALSRGITDQVRGAYRLAMGLLLIGALLSILKGIDFEEATFLLLVAGVLRSRRRDFYRESLPLFSRRSLYWLLAAAACLVGYYLLGAWLHEDVVSDGSLWFLFGPGQDAARFLRSLPFVVLVLLGFLGWTFFRMPRPELVLPDRQALDEARRLLQTYGGHCFSHMVFMGDKYLFHSKDRRAMIMFGRIRDRLVALGDPMGAEDAFSRAIAEFRDFADRHDLAPIFYEVDEDHVHHYHDNGFSLFKVGEMAYVPVAEFTLSGKRGEALRNSINRARREGLEFALAQAPFDETLWSELNAVSDDWLAALGTAEKGFSLGRFEREYLSEAGIALVRKHGTLVAFASLMPDYAARVELSIDLMRQASDSPPGTMDFLFVQLIEYARAQGYKYFNLGMAPLSGVGGTRFARSKEKVARVAYEYGNRFYKYKGLRSFKEKFNPEWRSRYIAYPVFTSLPGLLVDIAALIAGGYRRILFKTKG